MLDKMASTFAWAYRSKSTIFLTLKFRAFTNQLHKLQVLGQVWYLIVSISDPWCLSYFYVAPSHHHLLIKQQA